MSVYMASFGYELLAALHELLAEFDDGSGGDDRIATISSERFAALEERIARGAAA